MEQFEYLGTTLTNQNSIRGENNGRLKSGISCYHLVQNLLPYIFAIQKYKDKDVHKYNSAFCLCGCETCLLTLREERRLRVFENRVLRGIFGSRRDEVTGECRKLHNEDLNDLYCSSKIVRVIKLRKRWVGYVACLGGE